MLRLAAKTKHRRGEPGIDRIYFLVVCVDGTSGVPRTLLTLANELVKRHPVEIISVYRRRAKPAYSVDRRISLRYLYDQRPLLPNGRRRRIGMKRARLRPEDSEREASLDARPSTIHDDKELSLLTDLLLLRTLPQLEPGVLVSVRPALHLAAALLAPPHVITVAQDHSNFPIRMSSAPTAKLLKKVVQSVDGLVALTREDATDYAAHFRDATATLTSIPNAAPWPAVPQLPDTGSRVVVSAGRLERVKGFDRLITAYAPLARTHPDWQLHIYGRGNEHTALQALITDLGVAENVKLMGFATDLAARFREASIYGMASISEGFPMVLLEAMSCGLPLVSYDCPRGPSEIISDGHNGLLIPDGQVEELTAGLAKLMSDEGLRRGMARNALTDVQRYSADSIAHEWEAFFEQLLQQRTAT